MKNLLSILFIAIVLTAVSCEPSSSKQNSRQSKIPNKPYKFYVLYPQPTDITQFELEYSKHLELLDSLMGYTQNNKPYNITKLDQEVFGSASTFYQMFTLSFENQEELVATINSKEMKEAGKDAARISTGGAPVILIGSEK